MKAHGEPQRGLRVDALREERAANPLKTSPVPAVDSPGLPVALISKAAVGMCEHAARALDDDRCVEFRRQRLRGAETIGLHIGGRRREEPRGFGRMRRCERRGRACRDGPGERGIGRRSDSAHRRRGRAARIRRAHARRALLQPRRCRVRARRRAHRRRRRPRARQRAASIPAGPSRRPGRSAAANPTQTLPAPAWSAARPASNGAPVMPAAPPTIASVPNVPLCTLRARRRSTVRQSPGERTPVEPVARRRSIVSGSRPSG